MASKKDKTRKHADTDLGQRLRALREGRGLSLRALAQASQVTAPTLSRIENGKSSPSVSTLKRVLNPLGTTLGEFFTASEPQGPERGYIIRARQLVNVASSQGLRYLTPPGAGRGKAIQIMHEVYEAGADTGPRLYVHEGEEAGFCLEGTIEVTVAGRRERLQKGDAYQFPSNLPHRWRNIGNGRARLISACTPPSF
jgi:transcriptional regulator with XRE-family HTH domain